MAIAFCQNLRYGLGSAQFARLGHSEGAVRFVPYLSESENSVFRKTPRAQIGAPDALMPVGWPLDPKAFEDLFERCM